ncbi:MAG: hypothetical protein RIS29_2460 [Bacteroidota bacterium]|jgi:hypothetical protein
MNKYVSGAVLVTVPLNNNQKRFYFPEQLALKGKRIKHIERALIPATPDDVAVIASDIDAYVTFTEQNTQAEKIQALNTKNLNISGNRLYINKLIDWERSYVTADPSGHDFTDKVICFIVWYDYEANRNIIPSNMNRTSMNNFELKLNGTRTYFGENLLLRGKKFQNILLNFPAITPLGNEGLDIGLVWDKFITLSLNNVEFFQKVPLYVFYQTEDFYQLRLQNIQFDFQNSYIDNFSLEGDLKSVFFNCIIDENK